jgi:hydrogenase maturation protease
VKKIVVIGYGNELRGDDGIGPYVADQVAALGLTNVHALALHQLTPELAEMLAEADLAVFVDARADAAKGAIHVSEVAPRRPAAITGHVSTPHGLVQLAAEVHGKAPRAWLVTVSGRGFGFGVGLSAAALADCEVALEWIESLAKPG